MTVPARDLPALLRELLRRAEASYPDRSHRLWEVWEEAVGADVAQRAYPLELRRGRLTLAVATAPWMQQLSLLREQLREAVNRALGTELVRDVRFRLCPPEPPPPPRSAATPPAWLGEPLDPEVHAEIDAELAPIGDPALRASLRQVRVRAEQARRYRQRREAAEPPPSTGRSRRGA
ncbi:MAG: DUF721 domain-containing protein [Deltaproteobacteria bacterium]|nr:DUF721 domain-containing protein [Deltaproteobacteria bacterium]